MSVHGKLSSYFTAKRQKATAPREEFEASKEEAPSLVRARLEQKLLARKKGFAFNFQVEDDDPRNDVNSQRTAFRFGFNPSEEPESQNKRATEPPSKTAQNRRTGNGSRCRPHNTRPSAVGIDDWIVTPTAGRSKLIGKKCKKGGGKKSKGKGKRGDTKKGNDSAPRVDCHSDSEEHASSPTSICSNTAPSRLADTKAARPTSEQDSNSREAASENNACKCGTTQQQTHENPLKLEQPQKPSPTTIASGPEIDMVHPLPTPPNFTSNGRVPPGLTLESWKDPALSEEERRRRRFGRGVRNMAAIQRRQDRRGAVGGLSGDGDGMMGQHNGAAAVDSVAVRDVNSEVGKVLVSDKIAVHDERAPGNALACGNGGGGGGGGSSVFAFGFDIGISFNGS